jgi:hypothetical protein
LIRRKSLADKDLRPIKIHIDRWFLGFDAALLGCIGSIFCLFRLPYFVRAGSPIGIGMELKGDYYAGFEQEEG